MWYLESFDNATEFRKEIHPLVDLTADIVKQILNIDDSEFDLPVAVRSNDVPLDLVPMFDRYAKAPITVDPDCEYFVSFLSE